MVEVHDELQVGAWLAPDLHLRRGARGITGPIWSGLPTRPSASGCNASVTFVSLGERPATSGLELEDGHPLGRGVVWSSSRIELGDASVLDAELLAEQLVVLSESVVVGYQSDAGIDAVGGPAASSHDGAVGQGNDVQNG